MSEDNKYIKIGPVADSVPYDNTVDPDCDLISDTVQEAIDELCTKINESASPGFTWGRGGNLPNNTWLLNDTVPSNRAGRTIMFDDLTITDVFVATENIDTYDVSIFSHDGDEINLTLLVTVSIVAARSGQFTVSSAVAKNKQLASRITDGSAKNLVAGIVLKEI